MATAALVLTREDLDAMLVRAAEEGAKRALEARGHADEWLDQTQAAKVIGCARSGIPRLVKRHGLPTHKVDRLYRFRRDELDAWLASRPGKTPPSTSPPRTTPSGSRTLRAISGGR